MVTYFKQSSLYCKSEKSLKQDSDSRWNSKLEMLESISDQFEIICELLTEKNQMERVENIDIKIVESLINFLKKFREASECLEASKYPTIHLVLPWYKILLSHCEVSSLDDEILKQIKLVVGQKILDKIKIHDLYKLTLFFDPRMKQLKILDLSDAEWVKTEIRYQYDILSSQLDNNESGDDNDNEYGLYKENPSKKRKKSNDHSLVDFSQFYDSDDEIEKNENEIDKYLSLKIQKELDLDILEWWKTHQDEYPKLSLLCSYYLSIPASKENFTKTTRTTTEFLFTDQSAESQRSFSY